MSNHNSKANRKFVYGTGHNLGSLLQVVSLEVKRILVLCYCTTITMASLATVKANSHMSCHTPAILSQCRGLCESPRGSQKYPNC
jgi:hypothetical protein